MYYVIEIATDEVIGITHTPDTAKMLANMAEEPCMIRLKD